MAKGKTHTENLHSVALAGKNEESFVAWYSTCELHIHPFPISAHGNLEPSPAVGNVYTSLQTMQWTVPLGQAQMDNDPFTFKHSLKL